ncbi:MAG: macro domain-containing protein [Syntrophomonadaceae bacterium]|nr:macro domain-containing protein [Thermoanaerobacterales bacterium]NLN20867.1 macro domain-containing protein [Syntrophomonadaceae bacterium]HAF16891.1 O-acetyl-ADP-ribose deacetylase [Peptococcaceae bacterium]
MLRKVNNSVLELIEGDITEMDTDAIVNAANSYLKHGGGVAGAIVRKGGQIIQEESDKIGYCPVGQAVITSAGSLKARYVIHTVGPRKGEGNEDEKLKNATINSLRLADRERLKSIAFPAISAGIFGFPIDRCAEIMLKTTIEYLRGDTGLNRVVFCLFGLDSFAVFQKELAKQLPEENKEDE